MNYNVNRTDLAGGLFGLLVVLPITCSAFAGLLVIIGQCSKWLKFGIWQPVTVQDAWIWWTGNAMPPDTGLVGLDKILRWSADSPISLWLVLFVPAIWFAVSALFEKLIYLVDPQP